MVDTDMENCEPSAEDITRLLKDYEKRMRHSSGTFVFGSADRDLLDEMKHFFAVHRDAIRTTMTFEQARRRASYRRLILTPAGVGLFAAILLSLVGSLGTTVSLASQVFISAGAFAFAATLAAALDALHRKKSDDGRPDEG